MALQVKHADYAPVWNGAELNLQAMNIDDFDIVWGGTTSFDFARSDLIANSIYNNDQIKSLRVGADPVVAKSVQNGDGSAILNSINTDKGLPLYKSRSPILELPSKFDLNTYGATPSAVVYVWLKKTDLESAGVFTAGMSFGAMNSGATAQWIFGVSSGKFVFTIGSSGSKSDITAADVSPIGEYLLSIFIQKTSSARFLVHAYVNGTKISSADRAYPLNNASSNPNSLKPAIGGSSGSGGLMKCILRRCGVRVVDPTVYTVTEHEAWIAEQIAANSGRFP